MNEVTDLEVHYKRSRGCYPQKEPQRISFKNYVNGVLEQGQASEMAFYYILHHPRCQRLIHRQNFAVHVSLAKPRKSEKMPPLTKQPVTSRSLPNHLGREIILHHKLVKLG